MSFHITLAVMGIETTRTRLGTQFSEGARLLWLVVEERDASQGQIAKMIGARSGMVPRWLYGDIKPSWGWAVKLRTAFDIPLEAWTLEPREPFVLPAARKSTSDVAVVTDDAVPSRTGTDS